MTTLAIIGGGIAGRSLLYNLTEQNNPYSEILFFESPTFAFPCALHSTAIVAPRGVTAGHSPLGDLILEGFTVFNQHVLDKSPNGVFPITQYTGAEDKIPQFKVRYPQSVTQAVLGTIPLKSPVLFAEEKAHMVDPAFYLNWLMVESEKKCNVLRKAEYITQITEGEVIKLKTHQGHEYEAQHVVFATGAQSRFWRSLFPQSKLKFSTPVQGAYLEFSKVPWELPSFSLTLDGHNIIYQAHAKKLLIGSSTHQYSHSMGPLKELHQIYDFFRQRLDLPLPAINQAQVRVGLREKAQKREPYMFTEKNIFFIGGLYKNGFTLSLKMTRDLAHQLRALL